MPFEPLQSSAHLIQVLTKWQGVAFVINQRDIPVPGVAIGEEVQSIRNGVTASGDRHRSEQNEDLRRGSGPSVCILIKIRYGAGRARRRIL